LYQINVEVPSTGLASGDDIYVEIVTDTASVNQIQIPYGSAGGRLVTAAHPHLKRPQTSKAKTHRIKRGQ
jgi:hypothetical protein